MVTFLADDAPGMPSVAYAINRGVGGAVQRNRLRRRLRAIVHGTQLAPGRYLISASRDAIDLPFTELAGHVHTACARR
jgi:ribonuclease P protein component